MAQYRDLEERLGGGGGREPCLAAYFSSTVSAALQADEQHEAEAGLLRRRRLDDRTGVGTHHRHRQHGSGKQHQDEHCPRQETKSLEGGGGDAVHGGRPGFGYLSFQRSKWFMQSSRQASAIPQKRAGRPASAASMAKNMPNRLISRQTMVKRRTSIGLSFNGEENARMPLNRF